MFRNKCNTDRFTLWGGEHPTEFSSRGTNVIYIARVNISVLQAHVTNHTTLGHSGLLTSFLSINYI